MDLQVKESCLPICETVTDVVSEQPIDGDFMLPEYCPDVASVLKCTVTPLVQNRQLSTDRLLAEGVTKITVLYLDEERRAVRCCEFLQPFSASFAVPPVTSNVFVRLVPTVDYVNCRAVSPRRLDVHGAFTLRLKIQAISEKNGVSAMEGDGVFSRKQTLCSSVPTICAEKTFSINEVLDPGQGKGAAEQMLRVRMTPIVDECRVLTNKAIVKGKIAFEALYLTDTVSGTTETVSGALPFSQIVDADGLTEEWLCDAEVTLSAGELHVESSQSGGGARLSLNVKLVAALCGWREVNGEFVSDAYSSYCPLLTDMQTLEIVRLDAILRDERTVRHVVDMPTDSLQSVTDIWCDVIGAGMTSGADGAVLEGRLLWCMIVQDSGGERSYYERTESFSLPYTDGGYDETPAVLVTAATCNMSGNGKIELKADLHITRRCGSKQTCSVLRGVTADESAAYAPEKATLKVCHVSAGESVWEIARRCHTSAEAVMEENHLVGDRISADTMLLVPIA